MKNSNLLLLTPLFACVDNGKNTTESDTEQAADTSNDTNEPDDTASTNSNCTEGEVRETELPCGPEDEGVYVDVCENDDWALNSLCLLQAKDEELQYTKANIFAGYGPVEWDYGTEDANRIHGWSYYLRAFDLIQDQPVAAVGWGQWTKPRVPDAGLEVCGLHPHGFTCEGMDSTDPTLDDCGHTDPTLLESCEFWECGTEDKGGIRGSIEGGMGYWMYTLETDHVKWMMPGSTNMNYEIFGGTFLHDRPQPCSTLGGAVRISNRLLVPNDFLSFSGDKIDGFVGYMLSKTPIGKRSEDDAANNWTIIIDAANFAGPVMYMSSWFWDSRANWSPKSISWSDPRALIGYISQGFEGGMGKMEVTDDQGNRWFKTNRWALPKDQGSQLQSTLFTGHSQYNENWGLEGIEPVLAGTSTSGADGVKSVAMSKRQTPACNEPLTDQGFRVGIEEDDTEHEWENFGVLFLRPDVIVFRLFVFTLLEKLHFKIFQLNV